MSIATLHPYRDTKLKSSIGGARFDEATSFAGDLAAPIERARSEG
jgi:hypothetical protein